MDLMHKNYVKNDHILNNTKRTVFVLRNIKIFAGLTSEKMTIFYIPIMKEMKNVVLESFKSFV
jgi:hypothetical protein